LPQWEAGSGGSPAPAGPAAGARGSPAHAAERPPAQQEEPPAARCKVTAVPSPRVVGAPGWAPGWGREHAGGGGSGDAPPARSPAKEGATGFGRALAAAEARAAAGAAGAAGVLGDAKAMSARPAPGHHTAPRRSSSFTYPNPNPSSP